MSCRMGGAAVLLTGRRTALGILLFLVVSAAGARTICVNAAAAGANNGGCWLDAYTSLQAALAASVNGDEIWVEAGTYKPTATTDRIFNFALKNGVGVYGGFAGTETLRSQRDPATHVTILSGDIGTVGVPSDNSYHVVTSDSTVTNLGILDGFTITGGNANGPAASNQDRGGGMWVNGGAPTVAQCIFTGNTASEKGGGIRVTNGSPVIDRCTFTSNAAGAGGGGIGAGSGSAFTVKNTVFRGNSTVSTGGAGLETANGVTAVNCVFQNNSGNGVLFIVGGAIINSTVTGNSNYGVAFIQDGTVSNSILWGDATDEVFAGFGTIIVTYSDVGGSGFPGPGNISANPLFANPGGNDLRLNSGSLAIDAANNAGVPGGITTDIAGLPRFFDDPAAPNTGSGSPPIVDMGANERVPLTVSAPSPSPQTLCAGVPASFSVTASGQEPLTYQWRRNGSALSNGGPLSGVTSATLMIDPTATGDTGNYDVVVTDSFGQTRTSVMGQLTVHAVPSAPAAGSNSPVCVGSTLALTASSVAGATYGWTGPNGFASSQQNPTIPNATTAASGTYSVTVTVSGCLSPAGTTAATVHAPPAAAVSASSVCANSTGNSAFVADAGAGASYAWSITNGSITAGMGTRAIVFTAGASGTVALSVMVTDGDGCSANGSKNVPISASCTGNRIFVSARNGNDANNCASVATPCQSFAAAVAQVKPGGEVLVLDSGGYGAVTISRAVTIEAPPGVLAFIHPSSGDGVTVNAGTNDTVVLRGLTLNGGASNGIAAITVGALHVENCIIGGFATGLSMAGSGRLFVKDTIVRGNSATGVNMAVATGEATASIDRSRFESNGVGLMAGTAAKASIRRSVASGNGSGLAADGAGAELNIDACLVSNNGTVGVAAGFSGGTVHVSRSTVTDNGIGLQQSGSGILLSRTDNTVEGNMTNTSGTIGTYAAK